MYSNEYDIDKQNEEIDRMLGLKQSKSSSSSSTSTSITLIKILIFIATITVCIIGANYYLFANNHRTLHAANPPDPSKYLFENNHRQYWANWSNKGPRQPPEYRPGNTVKSRADLPESDVMKKCKAYFDLLSHDNKIEFMKHAKLIMQQQSLPRQSRALPTNAAPSTHHPQNTSKQRSSLKHVQANRHVTLESADMVNFRYLQGQHPTLANRMMREPENTTISKTNVAIPTFRRLHHP